MGVEMMEVLYAFVIQCKTYRIFDEFFGGREFDLPMFSLQNETANNVITRDYGYIDRVLAMQFMQFAMLSSINSDKIEFSIDAQVFRKQLADSQKVLGYTDRLT